MITNIQKSFKPGTKTVNYLSRDFGQLKQSLIQFAQYYYPTTYKDFNEGSTGMMFIEMSSVVGDILSYYTDYQFKESILLNAQERRNIINLAYFLGYRAKPTTPAVTSLDVYQLVPSIINADGTYSPDLSYAQTIKPGMQTVSDSGISFITDDPVDFTVDTTNSPLSISVFQRNASGQPDYYVLQKNVGASAGQIVTKTFNIGNPQAYFQLQLTDTNVIEVIDVYDSDGNRWYETDYMANDLVAVDQTNLFENDNQFYINRDTVPFLLEYLQTSRRFITAVNADNSTFLQFGAGINAQPDALIVPSNQVIAQVGLSNISTPYDPANFLKTKAYGQAPGNTVLTVRYTVGGGLASNVNSNSITNIVSADYYGDVSQMTTTQQTITNLIRSSLKVNNPIPATGGQNAESNEDIRNNAMANFAAQNRAVTEADYVVRTYSMPAKYGSIAKAYVATENSLDNPNDTVGNNQFAINLYILSQDSNGNLITSNPALINNLTNYLGRYRMLTDSVNILDGFIINVGVDFAIIAAKNFNKRDVLANCLTTVQNFFNINNMQFCQPINLSQLNLEIANVDGVQSISYLNLTNLTALDGDYSPYSYNIPLATLNQIVYPSIDPCVFEVKYPTQDITGTCQ